jgi:hypothetical protein
MIANLTPEKFAEILHGHLSPTAPIQSQEHLYGRDAQVSLIKQALYAPGRSIFIYGDRGVGKTSLAQTVAFAHQSSKRDPVILACTSETTFGGLIRHTVNALSAPEDTDKAASSTTTGKIGMELPKGLGSANFEIGHTRKKAVNNPVELDTLDLNAGGSGSQPSAMVFHTTCI